MGKHRAETPLEFLIGLCLLLENAIAGATLKGDDRHERCRGGHLSRPPTTESI